jgi:Flp pilus assembly protein TadG
MNFFSRFAHHERGSVAIMFAFAFLPMLALVGAGLDYTRAVKSRTLLQTSLDAAVLVAAREGSNLTDAQVTARARALFDANMASSPTPYTLDNISLTRTGKKYLMSAQATIDTSLLSVIGINSVSLNGVAASTWGDNNIEIALVLDNTGSMASSNKMTELKRALCGDTTCTNTTPSSGFMKIMRDAAGGAARIKVGIVPFDTTVRMPQDIQNAVNAGVPFATSFFAPVTAGYCTSVWLNDDAQRVSWFRFADRDKDTRAGNSVFASGNWQNVGAGCGTNGPARVTPATWQGCVWDRDVPANRDIKDGDISQTDISSLHPAVNCRSNSLARLRPLADIWSDSGAMVTHFSTMQPSGNTNLTVGISWGLSLLTNQAPFTDAAPAGTPSLYRVMIVLTDGDNTENRSSSNQGTIDARTRLACTQAKSQDITIYTVRVIDGNQSLLRDCATDTSKYFEVANASQLTPVFQTIANQIGSIRITQ